MFRYNLNVKVIQDGKMLRSMKCIFWSTLAQVHSDRHDEHEGDS